MESDEESGSKDMDYWLDYHKERIGRKVKQIWITDSGAADYETLWITSSLRGFMMVEVEI